MSGKSGKWTWEEDGAKVVRSIARTGPGCHEGCGVLLYVKNGKLVKVAGDPEVQFNQGRLCPRCLALPQLIYHPDRLKYPLIRAGARGEDKWKRITWAEAYETVARNLIDIRKQYGAESVIFCRGTGRDIDHINRLADTFGSPNASSFLYGNCCLSPQIAVQDTVLGNITVPDCSQFFPDRYQNPNWKVPECLIIWGNNPLVANSNGFLGHWIIECMKRGSELIVIDPRRTWLATRARIWLQIRPGTDAALALGMLNVIINERLYDAEFVQKWTYGFDELKQRVQEYPPDKVAEITWIAKDKIIEASRFFAKSKPSAIKWGVATEMSKECVATAHAQIALWSITGNLDVPGGHLVTNHPSESGQSNIWFRKTLTQEQQQKRIGRENYPFLSRLGRVATGAVAEQILTGTPYPIKAAWIQGTNPIAGNAAEPRKVYKALRKLDFVAVVDLFMTPTAMGLADIVLPAATYAERDGIGIPRPPVMRSFFGATNKAIEPVGECKSDLEIVFEIGKRMNPEAWPWKNIDEVLDEMAKPFGLTFNELREKSAVCSEFEYRKFEKGLLRADKQAGFNTPTGKVELYSTEFKKCGLDPLPYFEEPPESPISTPEIARDYPFILTTGARSWAYFLTEQRQIPLLRQINPDPVTELNPETAQKLGIKDGDWIIIESKYGKCKQKAKLTNGIHPGVIGSQQGWWYPEKAGAEPDLFGVWESNINLLLPGGWTGRSGHGYPYKCQMCRVYKAEDN
ncbi:MAG: molybdopterin-dependent oxidoreductase [Dehalococcoidales bacterium]|nr:molybdopterin-dependent oxidoreductase [Dehalococcoidales bacterium]